MPLQIFHRIEGFCVFFCQRQPLFIPCQIVSQPHAARKKTGAPVINRYIGDTTICIDGSWIQNFTGFLDNVCLNCVLCYCVVDVVLNKIDFNLFLSTATRKDQKRKSQCAKNCFHNTWIIC